MLTIISAVVTKHMLNLFCLGVQLQWLKLLVTFKAAAGTSIVMPIMQEADFA